MALRLVKVAKELNIGTSKVVDYLRSLGYSIENKPTSKISDEMYNVLIKDFGLSSKKDNNVSSNKIWKPVHFSNEWKDLDTSSLDEISTSWLIRRETLIYNSFEFDEFLERLKREHAIETGIVEQLYDLDKGITETFIKEGFAKSQLSHNDTNVDKDQLMLHLQDHFDSVDFIFDIVKDNRSLTTSFIKQLHQLVTKHQLYTDAIDQFGNRIKVELIKGDYKKVANNPSRENGQVVYYCPPEQVASEMDALINVYESLLEQNTHPLILATWFHHAFTIIHPFQDGNGRVARLLASLIFIKFNFFPITVLREEAKLEYINSLEKADNGHPQPLVDYFGSVQKRNIQRALNIKDVSTTSLDEVQNIFAKKIETWKNAKLQSAQEGLTVSRNEVFTFCESVMKGLMEGLKTTVNGNAEIYMSNCSFENEMTQHYYHHQIITYAKKHQYFFNRSLPKSWLMLHIELSKERRYQLGLSIHHFGYDENTLAIGSFLDYKGSEVSDEDDSTIPLDLAPHVISIPDNIPSKQKNIRSYIESAFTIALAQVASEMG